MTPTQEDWKGAALIILALAVGLVLVIIAIGAAFFGLELDGSTGISALILALFGSLVAYLGVRRP